MRPWLCAATAAVLLITVISPAAAQTPHRTTCRGEVKYGSLDSEVGDCGFITDSTVGKAILAVCTGGSRCEVEAEIEKGFVSRVFAVKVEEEATFVRFRTPSDQIHCQFSTVGGRTGLHCDINQTFVRTPVLPRPRDCDFDWGQAFELGGDSDAGLQCASDTVKSDDAPVLAYGSSLTEGNIVCLSETTGLTCRNAKGRGFLLSRKVQKIF